MVRSYYRSKSRLARTQSKNFLRQALFMLLVTGGVIYSVVRFGIPLLIKMAVFIGDRTGSQSQIEENRGGIVVAPVLQTLPEATFSAKLDITGFSQEGLAVMVFVNDQASDEVVAGSNGEFNLRRVLLRPGKNRIWAVARDQQGNKSNKSLEIVVVSDQSLPVITIDSPQDGEITSENSIEVRGLVDEKADVSINSQFVLVRRNNSFTKIINLSEGENRLLISAEDLAGNNASKEIKVIYSP